MLSRNDYPFTPEFNLGSTSVTGASFFGASQNIIPPPTGDFLLLNGTNFLLLDNTNFLLLD